MTMFDKFLENYKAEKILKESNTYLWINEKDGMIYDTGIPKSTIRSKPMRGNYKSLDNGYKDK